jgi:hypothetical protein
MKKAAYTCGDELLRLLGLTVNAVPVHSALAQLARGMQPELDPGDDNQLVDWVTVNEIGLEFGFEDKAYVRALDIEERRQSPLLLTQLYFYGDTAKTMPFPYPLPFGLDFSDDRSAVHYKLASYEILRRSYIRDAWCLAEFNMTIAYRSDTGRLESVLCYVPYSPWPLKDGERDLVASFKPEVFVELFGQRWSSTILRNQLEPLGYASMLTELRSEHNADLRMSHGIEFTFAPGRQVSSADTQFPKTLVLASVTYYGSRVYDAHEWLGPMPLNLLFTDSQFEIETKLGCKPDERHDFDRNGYAIWHFETYSLRAEYSNIENHLLRATIMAPGYWKMCGFED